jgi:glycosyltransferase involved in cell wall biosynthesis
MYFHAGLPVISAFQGDLRGLIENYETGFNYRPGDCQKIIDSIHILKKNPILYHTMSENSRNVFSTFFDTNHIYHEYVRYIETIADIKPVFNK